MKVVLLAERLRVEERLLIDACAAVGIDARLVTPGEIGVLDLTMPAMWCGGRDSSRPNEDLPALSSDDRIVVSRLFPTREATALAWALDEAGMGVVNSPRAYDLLSRRDQLARALAAAEIATPLATFAWGQDALLEAVNAYSWPVELLPLEGGQPGIVVEDREAAEAVIEHRAVLGGERVMLVRRAALDGEQRRVLIAGDLIQAARFQDGGWVADETSRADRHLARSVAQATGGRLLDVLYLPGEEPVVTLVAPLIGFRDLQAEGIDVASAIAACLVGIGAAHV